MTLALGVLISGSGTNLQAILDATRSGRLDAEVKVVVSNVPHAFGLERAKRANIPTQVLDHKTFSSREAFDDALLGTLSDHRVEWVALAGFMRVLRPKFLEFFRDRTVNIHPSLLPAFPGVDAQKQAIDYGVKVTGCTVHFVDPEVDSGAIITQRIVPILAEDTRDSLAARILVEEHGAFIDALQWIAEGRVSIVDGPAGRRHVRVRPTNMSP